METALQVLLWDYLHDGGVVSYHLDHESMPTQVCDFKTMMPERTLTGHGGDVKACDWHPTKSAIASGSKDATVKLWDARAGDACLSTLELHKGPITLARLPFPTGLCCWQSDIVLLKFVITFTYAGTCTQAVPFDGPPLRCYSQEGLLMFTEHCVTSQLKPVICPCRCNGTRTAIGCCPHQEISSLW